MIIDKIIGVVLIVLGIWILMLSEFIFPTIGGLTAGLAEYLGLSEMAVLGVQAVGWILTVFFALSIVWRGYMLTEGRVND